MSKSLLWGLGALCFFISAGITYYNNDNRLLMVIMQAVAGLLFIIIALKSTRRA
jgi:hypothetical protein